MDTHGRDRNRFPGPLSLQQWMLAAPIPLRPAAPIVSVGVVIVLAIAMTLYFV